MSTAEHELEPDVAVDPTQVRRWRRYPAYRDSGVVWLREIPAGWDMKPLKHASRMNPEVLREDTDPNYVINYVDISNVSSQGEILGSQELRFEASPSRARRRVQQGDTILSTVRTYLKAIAFIDRPPENLVVSTGFAVLRPSQALDARYLWWFLQSEEFVSAVIANSEGVGYPAINPARLGSLTVAVPPIPDQRAIASFLDRETARTDALVAKKERLIGLLQEKRTALISHAVTRGLNPNAPMRDSGVEWLRAVPTHWDLLPLRRAVSFLTDFEANGSFADIKDNTTIDAGEPFAWYVRATDLENGRVGIVDGNRYCDEATYRYLSKTCLFGGELLVTKRGEIGKVYLMPHVHVPATLAPNLYLIRLNSRLLPAFAYYWFTSNFGNPQLILADNSTTIGALYKDDVKDCMCVFPPISEQQRIITHLNASAARIDRLVERIQLGITHLREYRTALISAAVTGKIDVREEPTA